MILVDTSVWADHLRRSKPLLLDLLNADQVLGHPLVVGEIAMGSIANRRTRLYELDRLPQAERANDFIVRHIVETHRLYGTGLNYIDVQLLAATRLTPLARLWTRDKALAAAAAQLDVGFDPA